MTSKLTITITGDTLTDLEAALEEVTRLVVQEECTSGMNRNESGSFVFDISDGA